MKKGQNSQRKQVEAEIALKKMINQNPNVAVLVNRFRLRLVV